MSIDRGAADCDMSDVSVSESWADAQADTPTMGEGRSGSEDTLSNLSFDNILDAQVDPAVENNSDNNLLKKEIEYVGDAESVEVNGSRTNNDGIVVPVPAPRISLQQKQSVDSSGVKVCVTDVDLNMDQDISQIDLPPGTEYKPPSVDIARSPSQLKIIQGAGFMPKEEPGAISEDESSISSYQTHLDLNLRNGDARLTKRDDENKPEEDLKANVVIPEIYLDSSEVPPDIRLEYCEDSLQPDASDVLDDYIEDFYMPMSHETVMSRQTSFRRKVQKQLETVAAEKAVRELDKFEAMLATYDEGDEENGNTPTGSPLNRKRLRGVCKCDRESSDVCAACRNVTDVANDSNINKGVDSGRSSGAVFNPDLNGALRFQQMDAGMGPTVMLQDFDDDSVESPSLNLDIDAIVDENAPNLMGPRKNSECFDGIENGEESLSNYLLPQQTLAKLYSVYESSNFNNIYCLSGELKDILSATEMEEIIANKDHLEKVIDPNVIAALSWSLNDPSLFSPNDKIVSHQNQVNNEKSNKLNVPLIMDPSSEKSTLLKSDSKSSSMSNGFHSDASEDDNLSNASNSSFNLRKNKKTSTNKEKKMVPVKDEYLESDGDVKRGSPLNDSLKRKVSIEKLPGQNEAVNISLVIDGPQEASKKRSSLESLDDLGVGEDIDWEDDDSGKDEKASGIVLVRRDSKRFSFKGSGSGDDRYIEGLFVESKNPNPNGTLKRIRAPLNFSEDLGDAEPSIEFQGSNSDDTALTTSNDTSENSCKNPESVNDGEKTKKVHKKKISVDDKILSVVSADLEDSSQATDITESDVFHSIINTLKGDDDTMKTENGEDDEDITLNIDTPDDMEESIMEQLESIASSPIERIPELSAEEEREDSRRWKSFRVGPNDIQIDLKAIQPYRKVLSHGGYYDFEKKVAIILFSGCFLPDRSRKEYTYLMDHLFLYVLSTLEELIVEDYILVYLHGATPKSCMPTFTWLKRCYQLIDRRLRKNLKGLYLVHPTFWLKTIVALTKPFVSSKFSRKVQFVNTLSDLCLEIPTEHLVIPDRVLQYDFDLKVYDLKRRNVMS